jgi:hypothetical protein
MLRIVTVVYRMSSQTDTTMLELVGWNQNGKFRTILVINLLMAFVFASIYTFTLSTANRFSYDTFQRKRDYGMLDVKSNMNEALTQAGCYERSILDEMNIPSQRYTTVSPPCKCLIGDFSRYLWDQNSNLKTGESLWVHEPNADRSAPIQDLGKVLHDLKMRGVVESNTDTEEIISDCRFVRVLTTILPTEWEVNLVVTAALLSFQSVVSAMFHVNPGKLEMILVFILYAWQLVLIAFTLEGAGIALAMIGQAITLMVQGIAYIMDGDQVLNGKNNYMQPCQTTKAWRYVMLNYTIVLPMLWCVYNLSHHHLESQYFFLVVHLSLLLGLSLFVASNREFRVGKFDENGVMTLCNILVSILLYSMIPENHTEYHQTVAMQVSSVILVFYMMLPAFASSPMIWSKGNKHQEAALEPLLRTAGATQKQYDNTDNIEIKSRSFRTTLIVLDTIFCKVILIAVLVDMVYIHTRFR